MFGILEAVAVPHSGVYDTYEDLMKELNGRMEKEGYKIVKARSHRSRMGGADIPGNEIVRCDLVCDRGGRPYKCMATKHKTTTKKTDCPWKAKAVNRKTIGGWVLTISCDQHNHAPGTPEPPTPSEASDDEGNIVMEEDLDVDVAPRPDAETSTAMQLAGITEPVLRLTGDAFHQLKTDYRKMSHPDRLNALAQLQLRLAAIYAVQNEDWQRQRRQDAQDKRHQQVDHHRRQSAAVSASAAFAASASALASASASASAAQKQRMRRQRRQTEPIPQADVAQQALPQPPQPQAQPPPQLSQDAQAAQIQTLMPEAHFQVAQNAGHHQAPLPEMTMHQFQHFSHPAKRVRGQRHSMPGQSDMQHL